MDMAFVMLGPQTGRFWAMGGINIFIPLMLFSLWLTRLPEGHKIFINTRKSVKNFIPEPLWNG